MSTDLAFERMVWKDGRWQVETAYRHPQPLNLSGARTPCPSCGTTFPCCCDTDECPAPVIDLTTYKEPTRDNR